MCQLIFNKHNARVVNGEPTLVGHVAAKHAHESHAELYELETAVDDEMPGEGFAEAGHAYPEIRSSVRECGVGL